MNNRLSDMPCETVKQLIAMYGLSLCDDLQLCRSQLLVLCGFALNPYQTESGKYLLISLGSILKILLKCGLHYVTITNHKDEGKDMLSHLSDDICADYIYTLPYFTSNHIVPSYT